MTLTTLTLPSLLAAPATRTAPALVASHPIMGHAAIEVNGLERKFGGFVAVDRIQFRVEHGEVFGFLGPNGAGKSTTIKMLCTLLKPTAGAARVNGFDVATEPGRVRESR